MAAEEQRRQMREAGIDHPDATSMKTERAKQRRIDAEAARRRRAAKARNDGSADGGLKSEEEQQHSEQDGMEDFDDPARDAMYIDSKY
jgi:putative transposase